MSHSSYRGFLLANTLLKAVSQDAQISWLMGATVIGLEAVGLFLKLASMARPYLEPLHHNRSRLSEVFTAGKA
jgi:hypothetical protein